MGRNRPLATDRNRTLTRLALTLLLGWAGSAGAADIGVDTFADAIADDGRCSLREAVLSANQDVAFDTCAAGSGPDRILLQAGGFYPLTIPGAGEDQAYTGDLDVTDDLTVIAVGNPMHGVVDQTADDRVFHLLGRDDGAGRPSLFVELDHLVIQGGNAPTGGGIEASWAILNTFRTIIANNTAGTHGGGLHGTDHSMLRLYSSAVSQNQVTGTASGNGGGGIHLESVASVFLKSSDVVDNRAERSGGGLYLTEGTGGQSHNSRIRGNRAGGAISGSANGAGGGIANEGSFLLYQSEVGRNEAGTLDGAGEVVTEGGGGGIWNRGNLQADRTLVAENLATSLGGGIRNMVGSHFYFMTSTLSGNHAIENGGGLWHAGQGNGACDDVFASDFLQNATVAGNTSDANGDGVHVQPSGLLCFANTVVADGCSSMGTKGSVGNNLDAGSACDFGAGSGANTALGALADNGGPTRTHMPQTGSDAIDGGINSHCRPLDQRGAFRPPHPMGDPGDVCDVGAVESDGLLIQFEDNPFGLHHGNDEPDEEDSRDRSKEENPTKGK